ncbi:MAG: hypothetical protein Q8Q81_05990 [Oxalobacteraceae bacterium]|nr:hypothetical protein [Oxalobacteraceae bacterium]
MNHPTETVRMEPDALARILSYHERSKHRRERYAAGPDTLDWDAQPNPFREFAGAPRIALPDALGALRFAAAALGWSLQGVDNMATDELAALLGLHRDADFGRAEREEAELLLRLVPGPTKDQALPGTGLPDTTSGAWSGRANLLDPHPMYRWPLIDEVARASRKPAAASAPDAIDDARPPPR